MRTFKDNAGRNWTIAVNVDAIRRVRGLVSVDLLKAIEGTLVEQFVDDPVLLCDVLFALIKPDADAQQISDADFGRALSGDALDHAVTALLEDLVDFFPQGKRRLYQKAIAKLQQLRSTAYAAVETRLDSPDLQRELQEQLAPLTT